MGVVAARCPMLATIVRIPPSAEATDRAAWQLTSALDGIVSALSEIQPDLSLWPAPTSSISGALRESRDYRRARMKMKEILHRIECIGGEELEEDIAEALSAAEELAAEGAACGWRVGLATVRAATAKGVSE
jgi:hypothetical protein